MNLERTDPEFWLNHHVPVKINESALRNFEGARGRCRWALVLAPSGGPTQVGTTPRLAFRAVIGAYGGEVEMVVAL
jgi:hypothetical protein